jgi:hypothetical protein
MLFLSKLKTIWEPRAKCERPCHISKDLKPISLVTKDQVLSQDSPCGGLRRLGQVFLGFFKFTLLIIISVMISWSSYYYRGVSIQSVL